MFKLDPVQSEGGYYVGIEVVKNYTGALTELIPPLVISEGDQRVQELYLVSTIPITCPHIFNCFLRIRVRSDTVTGTEHAVSTCIYR